MLERAYRQRLEADLARWQADGMITPASGDAIRNSQWDAGPSRLLPVSRPASPSLRSRRGGGGGPASRGSRIRNQGKLFVVAAATPAGRVAIKRLLIDGE